MGILEDIKDIGIGGSDGSEVLGLDEISSFGKALEKVEPAPKEITIEDTVTEGRTFTEVIEDEGESESLLDNVGFGLKSIAEGVETRRANKELFKERVSREQEKQLNGRYQFEVGGTDWLAKNAQRYKQLGTLGDIGSGAGVGSGLSVPTPDNGTPRYSINSLLSLDGLLEAGGNLVEDVNTITGETLDTLSDTFTLTDAKPEDLEAQGSFESLRQMFNVGLVLTDYNDWDSRTTFVDSVADKWNYGFYGQQVANKGEEMIEASNDILNLERRFSEPAYLAMWDYAQGDLSPQEIYDRLPDTEEYEEFKWQLGKLKDNGDYAWKMWFSRQHWTMTRALKDTFNEGVQAQQEMLQYVFKSSLIERNPIAEAAGNAKTLGEAYDLFKLAPFSTTFAWGMESAYPSMVILTEALAVGKFTKPVGFVLAMGAGSFDMERTGLVFKGVAEKVIEAGGDLSDINSVLTVMERPEVYEAIKSDAILGASIVAVADMIAAGVSLKMLAPVNFTSVMAAEVTNMFAQMGTQMFLGGFGEALKQYVVDGFVQWGEVFAEALGEGFTAPADAAGVAVAGLRDWGVQKKAIAEASFVGPLEPESIVALRKVKAVLRTLEEKIAQGEEVYLKEGESPLGTVEELALDSVSTGVPSKGTYEQHKRAIKVLVEGVEVALGEAMVEGESQVFLMDETGFQTAVTEIGKFLETQKPGSLEAKKALADIAFYENLRDQQVEIQEAFAAQAQEWAKVLFPDSTIIVSLGEVGLQTSPYTDQVTLGEGKLGLHNKFAQGVHALQVNLVGFTDKYGNVDRRAATDALAHEFGHAVIASVYPSLPPHVRRLLQNAWREWLNDLTDPGKDKSYGNMKRYTRKTNGLYVARQQNRKLKTKGLAKESVSEINFGEKYDPQYALSFNEFLADAMSRASADSKIFGVQRKDLQPIRGALYSFWSKFRKDAAGQEKFNEFVQYLALSNAVGELEDIATSRDLTPAENVETVMDNMTDQIAGVLGKLDLPKGTYGAKEFRNDMVKFKWRYKHGYTLLQIAEKNPNVKGVQDFIGAVHRWWRTKSVWTNRAEGTLKDWKALDAWNDVFDKPSERLGEFMLDLTALSSQEERFIKEEEEAFQELLLKHKMSPEMIKVWRQVAKDMRNVSRAIEEAAEKNIRYVFRDNPPRAAEAVLEMRKNVRAMNNMNFFPMSRFGEFYVEARASKAEVIDGKKYKVGEQIWYVAVETAKEQKAIQRDARKAGHRVRMGIQDSTKKDYGGLPPQFLTFLQDQLKLSQDSIAELPLEQQAFAKEQAESLQELMKNIAPGQSFIKHRLKRRSVAGYSLDGMRSYANYFMHFANYIAKLESKEALFTAVEDIRKLEKAESLTPRGANEIGKLIKSLAETRDYLMSPEDEWASARAASFVFFLGFNVKSAVVNITQVPMVLYPYLAARHGDIVAVKAIGRAYGTATNYWLNPKKVSKEQMNLVRYLKETGIIDESAATEIAGVAQGSLLARLAPAPLRGRGTQRFVRNFMGKSAAMFQMAEKTNRYVSAFAAFELARKKGASIEEAQKEAYDAIATTQGEYARWNRPRFMRGKRSVLFMFWMYKQMMIHFTFNDPGNKRFMLMLFSLGGLMALPFAEDVADLLQWLVRRGNDKTFNIRRDVRAYVKDLGINPDIFMKGLLGPGVSIGDMTGTSIPNVDWSGSLTQGRVVPFMGMLGTEGDFNYKVMKGLDEFLGAGLGVPLDYFRAFADKNPDQWKRWEKVLPIALQNVSKAIRLASDGGVTNRNGAVLEGSEVSMDNTRDILSVGLQGLGFRRGESAKAQEKYYMTREIVRYYQMLGSDLSNKLEYAHRIDDTELFNKLLGEIGDYNDSVPEAILKIDVKQLKGNIEKKATQRVIVEEGLYEESVGLGDYIDAAFPDEVKSIGGGVVEEKEVKEKPATDFSDFGL